MEQINIGLAEEHRQGIVDSLNKLLADEHVLYIKTRNYHWNVVSRHFHDLHKFFEGQYQQLEAIIDEVAENVRQYGGVAQGTMAEFTRDARLHEEPGRIPDDNGMVASLLSDHESVIRTLREDITRADEEYKAADASDFLTSVLEQHNKMAWMLRATLPSRNRNVEPEIRSARDLAGARR